MIDDPILDDTYKMIANPSQGEYKEKGSRFMAFAFPVHTEENVKEKLTALRKEYHDARHHCYAYRLGAEKKEYRINDDREPSGSAGKPIMGQIESNDLTDILIVVVRYFGGKLLGVSGLINAYRTAAFDALHKATIITKTMNEVFEINFDYSGMNNVMKIIKDEKANVLEQKIDLICSVTISIRKKEAAKVTAKLLKIENVKLKKQIIFDCI